MNLREKKVLTTKERNQLVNDFGPLQIVTVEATEEMPKITKLIDSEGLCTSHFMVQDLFEWKYKDYISELPEDEYVPTGKYYTITYQTEYGVTPESRRIRLTQGQYILTEEDLPTLETEGYAFNSWSIDGVEIEAGDIIKGDATLVASWRTLEPATMIYGSKDPSVYPFIDIEEYYTYDGTYDHEGKTYYRWKKQGDEEVNLSILTDTRDFSGVDFDNPYTPVGVIVDDQYDTDGYYAIPEIYYGGTTEPTVIYPDFPHHDTSLLNANGHSYVDLGLPSGTLWAEFNIGATSYNAVETALGGYYAWGETSEQTGDPKYTWNTYRFGAESPFSKYDPATDTLKTLELTDDAARVNFGGDWIMPTNMHMLELINNTTSEWVENYNGVTGLNGRIFTSKVNGNSIFIPASGDWNDNTLRDVGANGYIWTSSLSVSDPDIAVCLRFRSGEVNYYACDRCRGFGVRPILY